MLIRRIKGLDVNIDTIVQENEVAIVEENNGEDGTDETENSDARDYENHRQEEHDTFIESFENTESNFSNFINDIKEQAEAEATTDEDGATTYEDGDRDNVGDRDNLMYNILFAKYFTDLAKTLPIWSPVNCQFFNGSDETASTAHCESYFKDCKLSHKDIIPCRVDTFVAEDVKMIDGCVIEASQAYITSIGKRNITERNTIECDTVDLEPPVEQVLVDEMSVEDSSTVQFTSQNYEESEADRDSTVDDSPALQKRLYNLYHRVQNSEGDFTENNVSATNTVVDQQVTGCVACDNRHFPDGAHRCFKCGKNVHVLSGCSNSIQDEEGYGEKRICISCSNDLAKAPSRKRSRSVDDFSSQIAKELNNREKWNKKKKPTKQSSYIHPVPNWDLVFDVDKKVKIGMLSNGNLSRTTYNVKGKAVALKNTCAFDTTAQVVPQYLYYFFRNIFVTL